jgi:hypothetical protein
MVVYGITFHLFFIHFQALEIDVTGDALFVYTFFFKLACVSISLCKVLYCMFNVLFSNEGKLDHMFSNYWDVTFLFFFFFMGWDCKGTKLKKNIDQ